MCECELKVVFNYVYFMAVQRLTQYFIFVQASKKKVYMLYNLEPDRSVSGGAWYQDQDFESEFVDILNRQCHRFLQQRADKIKNNPRGPIIGRTQSYATATEVQKYITDLGISNVCRKI